MADSAHETPNGWEIINGDELDKYGLTKIIDGDKKFPVAIVGMGCRLPDIEDLRDYRKVLVEQLCTYGPIPDERWSKDEWYSGPGPFKKGYTNSHTAGFIDYMYGFDNTFFNTSPKEAASMDPQQFHIMEVTQEALDDAGITRESLPRNTAVYMSMKMGEQTMVCVENRNILNPYILTGGAHTVTANRVNFFYDIRGPSMGVEGSCSAAIQSVHCGVYSLWNNECDAVLAGGVNYILSPHFHMNQGDVGMLSTKGECSPFDKDADGRVRSEGCGVLVLKPLADAIKDGDHVHCVIRESVLAFHGNNLGINMHTPEALSKTIRKVYDQTGVPPERVDYIETNGTGDPAEDLVEITAMSEVFGAKKEPLKIGSCKANVGHTENASGMTQLIKSAMMLGHREYYPQIGLKEIDAAIPEDKLKVQVAYESYTKDKNMLVGVTSMAFSGQMTHMLLEEYKNEIKNIRTEDLAGWHFGVTEESGRTIAIVLSAKGKDALRAMADRWLKYSNITDDAQIVASWLASKRSHYSNRMIVFANSSADFRTKLQDFLNDKSNNYIVDGIAPPTFQAPKICFVFPGQGQQWSDMGRSLYANEPIYRDIVHRCDAIWQKVSGYSFLEKNKIFVGDTAGFDPEDIEPILVAQPAIISHQIGLHVLLQHWGIKPDMVIGHSLGEVAAAYAADAMTLDECIISIYHRAYTQTKLTGTGSMAAARFSPEDADRFCEEYDDLYVACYNSTDNVTLSGKKPIVLKLADENPKKLKVIRVLAAFHTILVRPVRDEFFERMVDQYTKKIHTTVPMYSTVKKDVYPGPYDPAYWWTNIEQPVYFAQANKAIFRDHGSNVVFVEMASAVTLLSSIRQTANKMGVTPAGYVPCGARASDDWLTAMKGVAQLYFMGFPVNWENVTRNCARYVQIPTYPFQRSVHRLESETFTERRLGTLGKSYNDVSGVIDVQTHSFLADYKINGKTTMPASGLIEYLIELADETNPCLRDVRILHTPRVFDMDTIGEFDQVCMEVIESGETITLRTNTKAWNISPRQEDVEYASGSRSKIGHVKIPTKLDLSSIQNRCPHIIESNNIYEQFATAGLRYGDDFRVVTELSVGDGEVFGLLAASTNRFERIQTVTLDGAFQVILAGIVQSDTIYTVTSLDYVQLTEPALPLGQSLHVYGKLMNWDTDQVKVDIHITDTVGNVLASVIGATFQRMEASTRSVTIFSAVQEQLADITSTATSVMFVYGRNDAEIAKSLMNLNREIISLSLKQFVKDSLVAVPAPTEVVYLWNPKNAFQSKSRIHLAAIDAAEFDFGDIRDIIDILQSVDEPPSLRVIIPDGYRNGGLLWGYLSAASTNLQISRVAISRSKADVMAMDISAALDVNTLAEIQVKSGKVLQSTLKKYTEPQHGKGNGWSYNNGEGFTATRSRDLLPGEILVLTKAFSTAGNISQCSGVVQDAGPSVTKFRKGDRVLSLSTKTIDSQLIAREDDLAAIGNMAWHSSSAVGLTYGVASHVVKDLMRVEEGEIVYITDCSTPVGEACARMAYLAGAEVFSGVTTNLPFAKEVQMSTIHFSQELMKQTDGNGINVIICPEFEDIFDELLDCVTDTSRLCLISNSYDVNTEIVTDDRVTTYCFNTEDMLRRRPDILHRNIAAVLDMISDNKLPELQMNSTTLDSDEAISNQTLRTVIIPDGFTPHDVDYPTLSLPSSGTYVITDGYSGLALEIARWLAKHGAKHIALISQQGRTRNFHKYAVQNLQRHGAVVYDVRADLSQTGQFTKVLDQLKTEKAPVVRGIFHTPAAVLDTASPSGDHLSKFTVRHAAAAHVIHQESRDLTLDMFVLLSTVAGLCMSPILAEHAATAADQSALATERKKSGQAALVIQMGLIQGVTSLPTDPDARQAMIMSGIRSVSVESYLKAMEVLVQDKDVPSTVVLMEKEGRLTEADVNDTKEQIKHELVMNGKNKLIDFLSEYLMWPRDYFHDDVALRQYGVDHLIGRDVISWLLKEFGLILTLKDIANNITLTDIISKLESSI